MKYDNELMNDVYLQFNTKTDVDSYIAHEIKPIARFKACDCIAQHSEGIENGGIRSEVLDFKSIVTNAFVNVNKNDILYDVKTKDRWIVVAVTVDDDNSEKRYKMRPHKQTTIQIRK